MNQEQLKRMTEDKGFIAALDQSGGSTPKALKAYGVDESAYNGEEEMFTRVHEMRTRIIKSPSFDKSRILAAILFENTMDRKIDNLFSADFLWNQKGIVPILKVDKGLADEKDGVQLMKPIPGLDELLDRANERHIFGTKMRSVIKQATPDGIRSVIVVGIAHWLPPEMTPQIVRTFDLPDSETHEMQWVRIAPQTVYGREYPLLPAYLDGTHPDSDTLTS